MSVAILEYGLYETPVVNDDENADLSINFVLPLDFMNEWERCGLASDYLAQYQTINMNCSKKTTILLSTIINELMENAVKFSCDQNKLVTMSVRHFNDNIQIEAINTAHKRSVQKLKKFIGKLEKSINYEELFLKRLEETILNGNASNESGIGLLSILKDYDVQLGIKTELISEEDQTYRVFIQILLNTKTLAKL